MAMETVAVAGEGEEQKKNIIQVSNTKKPLFFYVNLAKRYIQQHSEVELSALGTAITTVVTIAEILKNNGLAIEKSKNLTSLNPKKLKLYLGKSDKSDMLMSTANEAPPEAASKDKE
ncbi:hypothetical protein REPUB_Repub16aG0115600 [Reevesia pubescens]